MAEKFALIPYAMAEKAYRLGDIQSNSELPCSDKQNTSKIIHIDPWQTALRRLFETRKKLNFSRAEKLVRLLQETGRIKANNSAPEFDIETIKLNLDQFVLLLIQALYATKKTRFAIGWKELWEILKSDSRSYSVISPALSDKNAPQRNSATVALKKIPAFLLSTASKKRQIPETDGINYSRVHSPMEIDQLQAANHPAKLNTLEASGKCLNETEGEAVKDGLADQSRRSIVGRLKRQHSAEHHMKNKRKASRGVKRKEKHNNQVEARKRHSGRGTKRSHSQHESLLKRPRLAFSIEDILQLPF